MANTTAIQVSNSRTEPPIPEIDILWITAGLGCDGDTIAITAATSTKHRRIVLGAMPWIPKVHFTIRFSPIDNGDDFMEPFHSAAEGKDRAVHSRGRRVDSQRDTTRRKATGLLSAPTRKPASRLRPVNGSIVSRRKPGRSWPPEPAPPMAAFTPWKEIRPAAWDCPTISAGSGNRRRGFRSSACPDVPCSPTISWRRCSILLYMAAGRAPMIPLDEALRPTWLFGATVHEGCDRGGYYEQARVCRRVRSPLCIVKLGCWGPVVQCNVGKRGWMGGIGGCPERRRHLHRMHHARLSRQVHALHESAAGFSVVFGCGANLWPRDSRLAPLHPGIAEQGAELAQADEVASGRTSVRRF